MWSRTRGSDTFTDVTAHQKRPQGVDGVYIATPLARYNIQDELECRPDLHQHLHLLCDVACGLATLHGLSAFYDVPMQNVLVETHTPRVALADWGPATWPTQVFQEAPCAQIYNDIWRLGYIFWLM